MAIILLLVPFHAFLTVWISSAIGHYTLLRLWKEFLLALLILGAIYLLITDKLLRRRVFSLNVARLIVVYTILLVICAMVALAKHWVTRKAMWYGLLVDLRYLVFFVTVLIIAAKSDWLRQSWLKLLLGPAILVAAFAVLQYLVLPYDFLKHFGYGPATIPPYETINHNVQHIRVASTTRGANPLGAYLLVPISALAVLLIKEKSRRRDKTILGLGLLLALGFSFSRSAWIGAILAIIIAVWLSLRSARIKRLAWQAAVVVVVIAGIATATLHNNHTFQDVFLHTDSASTAAESSNQGHSAAFKSAAKDIIHQPLGGGVGSAGPQSVYNNRPGRIAENYFLQIGQETGVLGMILFIAICVNVGLMLYQRRADPLALALLASLIGLSLVNFLSHAWEDDTLAYVWWGLAGLALAPRYSAVKRSWPRQ
ncbi:MAG: O-antigen ligase family protein [Candidatus Saccharimonadales bacterium]